MKRLSNPCPVEKSKDNSKMNRSITAASLRGRLIPDWI